MTTDEFAQPYQRIVNDVRQQIRLGRLKSNDQLPSTRALADRYGVAPGTVQRALAELRAAGLIYSHQGRGSFIRAQPDETVIEGDVSLGPVIREIQQQLAELATRVDRLERGMPENSHSSSPTS